MNVLGYLPLFIPVVKVVYTEILYPIAYKWCTTTPVKWDDQVLIFLDQLINHLLSEAGSTSRVEKGKVI